MPGCIENDVHHWLAGFVVLLCQNVAGNLDQIAVKLAFVPVGEHLLYLVVGHSDRLHQVVGFADQLHVAVFDAVVDHLDEVARSIIANPVAAGRAVVYLGGDGLEDRLNVRPGFGAAAGHNRWPVACAFFAAGYARADKEHALGLDVFGPADRVVEVAVTAIDDDIAFFKVRDYLIDECIHGRAGLNEQHHAAGALQRRYELFN